MCFCVTTGSLTILFFKRNSPNKRSLSQIMRYDFASIDCYLFIRIAHNFSYTSFRTTRYTTNQVYWNKLPRRIIIIVIYSETLGNYYHRTLMDNITVWGSWRRHYGALFGHFILLTISYLSRTVTGGQNGTEVTLTLSLVKHRLFKAVFTLRTNFFQLSTSSPSKFHQYIRLQGNIYHSSACPSPSINRTKRSRYL